MPRRTKAKGSDVDKQQAGAGKGKTKGGARARPRPAGALLDSSLTQAPCPEQRGGHVEVSNACMNHQMAR